MAEITVREHQRAAAQADIDSYRNDLVAAENAGDLELVAHIRREIADREKFLRQTEANL
ncbi:MAG TPA: hypothetical protein VHY35_02895 [Stellaceae bacterium]|jgi:hypothetical protein|nr:hypothetical protein [Stellaceae bacterium]